MPARRDARWSRDERADRSGDLGLPDAGTRGDRAVGLFLCAGLSAAMSRHAPRGPIKARPLDGETHERPKCTAKSSRTGQPCQKWPINGGTVCRTHGGAAPQVRAAAEKRLDELRPKAIQRLDWLLDQENYPTVILGAVKDVLDRNDGKPRESVDMNVTGQVDVVAVLRQRHARRAESLDKMAPSHGVETDASAG